VSHSRAFIPDAAAVAQLNRLLNLPSIRRSPNSERLLRHLFACAQSGQTTPSQYDLAYDVLGLGKDFDPNLNPIVRMQVGRLRRALAAHYAGIGAVDDLHVSLPQGSYGLRIEPRPVSASRRLRTPVRQQPVLALAEPRGIGLDGIWASLPIVLAEELMAALGHLPGLRLLGPFTRARLETDRIDPVQLGARHRADFVLDGSLQSAAEGQILRLRLLHGPSGTLVWSTKHNCGSGARDLAALEDALVARLAHEIGADYGVVDRHLSALARVRPAASLGVREALVTARAYFSAYTPELRDRALVSLRRACRDHPDESLPKASLALVLASLAGDAAWTKPLPLADIERLAAEAYRLDPASPWSLNALGLAALLLRRDTELESLAERVDNRDPAAVLIRGSLGLWLVLRRRRVAEGLAWVDDALKANPHHPPVLHMARMADRLLARDAKGVLAAVEAYNWPGGWMDALLRAAAAPLQGKPASAKSWLKKALVADPSLATHGLARLSRIWHEDYLAALSEILKSAGIRLSPCRALP
jgi:adenylate cyclase